MYYKLDQRKFARKLASEIKRRGSIDFSSLESIFDLNSIIPENYADEEVGDGEFLVVFSPAWRHRTFSETHYPSVYIHEKNGQIWDDHVVLKSFDTVEDAREFIFQEFGEIHSKSTDHETHNAIERYGFGKYEALSAEGTRRFLDSYNSYSMPDGVFPYMTMNDIENLYLDMDHFFKNDYRNYEIHEGETKKYLKEWRDKAEEYERQENNEDVEDDEYSEKWDRG